MTPNELSQAKLLKRIGLAWIHARRRTIAEWLQQLDIPFVAEGTRCYVEGKLVSVVIDGLPVSYEYEMPKYGTDRTWIHAYVSRRWQQIGNTPFPGPPPKPKDIVRALRARFAKEMAAPRRNA